MRRSFLAVVVPGGVRADHRRPGTPDLRHGRGGADTSPATPADDRQRASHRRASGRRGLGVHREDGARRSRARRVRVAEPRRGRPEHHRPRALRRARRHPHRGAAAGAPARRRGAVLRPHLRLRLLEIARGSGDEVGRARHARRFRARHPHVPAARRLLALLRHADRRPRPPPGGRLPDAARVQGRRRSE